MKTLIAFNFFLLLFASTSWAYIYDDLDFYNPSEMNPSHPLLDYSESVAVIVKEERLEERSDGTYLGKDLKKFLERSFSPEERVQGKFCQNRYKFQEEPLLGFCTATLIGPRHLITAGHCVAEQGTKIVNKDAAGYKAKIVFDFKDDLKNGPRIPSENVYNGKKIIFASTPLEKISSKPTLDTNDIALIELDRDVVNRKIVPVELNLTQSFSQIRDLVSISHPMGLPQKMVLNGKLLGKTHRPHDYSMELDNLKGSSGSSVIDLKSGKIIGVITVGAAPFFGQKGDCVDLYQCHSGLSLCLPSYFSALESIKSSIESIPGVNISTTSDEKWSSYYHDVFFPERELKRKLKNRQKKDYSGFLKFLDLSDILIYTGVESIRLSPSSLKLQLTEKKLELLDKDLLGANKNLARIARNALELTPEVFFSLLQKDKKNSSSNLETIVKESLKFSFFKELTLSQTENLSKYEFITEELRQDPSFKKLQKSIQSSQNLGSTLGDHLDYLQKEWSKVEESSAFKTVMEKMVSFWSSRVVDKVIKGVRFSHPACSTFSQNLKGIHKIETLEATEAEAELFLKKNKFYKNYLTLKQLKANCQESFLHLTQR